MPFSLVSAPSVAQMFVNFLWDMLGRFVKMYIDDILIYSCSLEQRIEHVRKFLQITIDHWKFLIFVKIEECEFHLPQFVFLVYVNIINSTKGQAVTEWLIHQSIRVQIFLDIKISFFYYYYYYFLKQLCCTLSLASNPHHLIEKTSPECPMWTNPKASWAQSLLCKLLRRLLVLFFPSTRVHQLKCIQLPFYSENSYTWRETRKVAYKISFRSMASLVAAKKPIILYMDHKNIEYLKIPKSDFFSCLHFTISFCSSFNFPI